MKLIAMSIALLGILAIAGCSSPRLIAPEGFPRMTVDPNDESTLVFAKPGLDLGGYRRVFIEPVRMLSTVASDTSEVKSAEALEIAQFAGKQFADTLGKQFEIVAKPGAGVLRLRFTITDLQPTSAAQVVMMVPPFAMVNMVSPKGAFLGSITLAGEFFEETATDPSVAFVAYRSRPGIDATVAFGRWTVAKKVISNAAERLANDLVALRSKG
jgi:hypothetical protein